jgi:hypothetical protein
LLCERFGRAILDRVARDRDGQTDAGLKDGQKGFVSPAVRRTRGDSETSA